MSVYALGQNAFALLIGHGLETALDLSLLKPHLADRSSVRCYYRIGPAVMGGRGELQIMRGSYLLHARCSKEAVGSLILADALSGFLSDGEDQSQSSKLLPHFGWAGVAADEPYLCLDVRTHPNSQLHALVWNETDLVIEGLSEPNDPTKRFTQGALYLWVDRPNDDDPRIKSLAPQAVSRARWLAEWMGRMSSETHSRLCVEEMEAISRLAKKWALVWGESVGAVEQLLLDGVPETS